MLMWHRVKAFLYLVWSMTLILFCLNIKQHTLTDFQMNKNMQKLNRNLSLHDLYFHSILVKKYKINIQDGWVLMVIDHLII